MPTAPSSPLLIDHRRRPVLPPAVSTALATWCVLGSPGCTDQSDAEIDESSSTGGEVEPIDERVEIPADGPGVLNFAGAEFVVGPGEERMICYSTDYLGPDIAYRNARSLQGKGGHHVILLGAKEPLPAGTVEDCGDGTDMSKYDLLMIPQELPVGYGTLLPAGRSMVIQSHYVNTTASAILVRDVVQLDTTPMADVTTWAAPIATNTIDLTIPAGETQHVTFDCELEEEAELLMVGGHMHEWGTKFELEVGPTADALESIYLVDPWRADFRDVPPVTLFLESPMPLAKGTVLRTHCYYDNTEAEPLEFPHEMCSTFGVLGGLQHPVECRKGEQ